VDEILDIALGMAVGGFLVSVGAYISFVWHSRLLQPLLNVMDKIFKALGEIEKERQQ